MGGHQDGVWQVGHRHVVFQQLKERSRDVEMGTNILVVLHLNTNAETVDANRKVAGRELVEFTQILLKGFKRVNSDLETVDGLKQANTLRRAMFCPVGTVNALIHQFKGSADDVEFLL